MTTPNEELQALLSEVAAHFTRDDDLPNDLLPRIDAALARQEEGREAVGELMGYGRISGDAQVRIKKGLPPGTMLYATPAPPSGGEGDAATLARVLVESQQQCDEDGTMIAVSRQAVDETVALLRRLATPAPQAGEAGVERGLPTDRRMKAVELLLSQGYRWSEGEWIAPATPQAAGVDSRRCQECCGSPCECPSGMNTSPASLDCLSVSATTAQHLRQWLDAIDSGNASVVNDPADIPALREVVAALATPTPQAGEAHPDALPDGTLSKSTMKRLATLPEPTPTVMLNMLREMREEFGRNPNRFTIEQAALDFAIAKASAPASPQGVSEAVVERARRASDRLKEWRKSMPAVWYGNAALDEAAKVLDEVTAAGAAPEGCITVQRGAVNALLQFGTCHEMSSEAELHAYVEARDLLLNMLAAAQQPGAQHGQEGRDG